GPRKMQMRDRTGPAGRRRCKRPGSKTPQSGAAIHGRRSWRSSRQAGDYVLRRTPRAQPTNGLAGDEFDNPSMTLGIDHPIGKDRQEPNNYPAHLAFVGTWMALREFSYIRKRHLRNPSNGERTNSAAGVAGWPLSSGT